MRSQNVREPKSKRHSAHGNEEASAEDERQAENVGKKAGGTRGGSKVVDGPLEKSNANVC